MPLLENTEAMRLGMLADDLLIQLRERIQFLKNFGTGFDLQPGERDNEYIVNEITDGTLQLRERENDNDSVIDDQSGNNKIVVKTKQLYTSETQGQKFLDSTTGRKTQRFIENMVNKFSSGIEARALADITDLIMPLVFTSTRHLGADATKITYADFQEAKILLNTKNHRKENGLLSVMLTDETMQDATAISEFKSFNVSGPGSLSNITGEPESALLGFNPQYSNLVRDANPQGVGNHTAAINEGGGIDDTVTTFGVDTQSPALDNFPIQTADDNKKQIKSSFVIKIESEYILITSVTYLSTVAFTVNSCVRGWWGSTAAAHADSIALTVVNSKTNFFYQGNQIISAFARQEEINDSRGIKVTAADEQNAMFLSIFKEPVQGKNGMWRYMVSLDIGFAILRDTAVIPATYEH